ncbi:MAG: glycosyltransferase family 9 protein [bacterium]|nr:glycosyltransferase family 9 protein [bacterium]MDZ4285030.1 glycosyltransferase family 9 protein [Patescibacteria group bacterium]
MIPNRYKRFFFFCAVIVAAPVVFVCIALRRNARRRSPKAPLRIVVLPQLTRIGDLVCATPVFRAIKERYPDAHLAVVTTNKVVGIIRNNPRIDEIIIYKSTELLGLVRALRSGNFDWSFSLTGTSFGNLIFFAGLVHNRAKITRSDRTWTERLTDWMASHKLFYTHGTYLPRRYLDLLRFIGIEAPREQQEIFVSTEAGARAASFLKEHGLDGRHPLIGVSVTAGNKIKEWGDARFADLARELIARYPTGAVVFLGAPRDSARIGALVESLDVQHRVLNKNIQHSTLNTVLNIFTAATDFSLDELAAFIKRLDLYIGVDTGPIYIAHALSMPLVDITGPVDPWEQPPHDSTSICVMPPAPFYPSSFVLKRPGSKEAHAHARDAISVEMVAGAAVELLGATDSLKKV